MSDGQLLPVDNKAKDIAKDLDAQYKLRMVSIGREVNIELNFLLKDRQLSVTKMDEIRDQLIQAASKVNEQHWVNINFISKEQWL